MKYFVILLFLIGFAGTAFATHEPGSPFTHSIVLPFDIGEKTFEEFMEWCQPFYDEKCEAFYAKNLPKDTTYQVPNFNFDKYSYTWGEKGKMLMISPLDNKYPAVIDTITAVNSTFASKISTYPDSEEFENFVFTETGPDTGIFVWEFVISEPQTKTAYATNANYIMVSKSTERIAFQYDTDPNTGYSTTAKITYPDDNTLPSDDKRTRIPSIYPNVQLRNAEMTSPYDGQGILAVQYPSQNISPNTIDQLKVALQAYDADTVFEILHETGKDTGIFEGVLPFSSYPSFSKVYLIKDDSNARPVSVQYLVSDKFSVAPLNSILLHHNLEYQDHVIMTHNDSKLSIHSDKKAYLDDQQIHVSGIAEPDELIRVSILSNRGSNVLFNETYTDASGKFETDFTWSESPTSGTYTVYAVDVKNDNQSTEHLVITNLGALQSRSIDVPPKQQYEMGLDASQIVCKQVWKSVLKPDGAAPACVKLPTYVKLLERGWTNAS
ncbi:MAG: hypothetical protein KC440_06670 [Nitrosarchaeum sp.]|nr:hypothetical protein [Nitrosarchaeum sp.]